MKYHYYLVFIEPRLPGTIEFERKYLRYSHTQTDTLGTHPHYTVHVKTAAEVNAEVEKAVRKTWVICEDLIEYKGEHGHITDKRIKKEFRQ